MATKQSYAADEAAGRVIPCVGPLAVDPVPEVRHAALATLDAFVKMLQEHSATRDTAAGAADGASQQVSCDPFSVVFAFTKIVCVCTMHEKNKNSTTLCIIAYVPSSVTCAIRKVYLSYPFGVAVLEGEVVFLALHHIGPCGG